MTVLQTLSRGIDHLGDLGAKLRDLQGFSTLAYELIQNADDVPQATSMAFDVRDNELIVDNDGLFSDCKRVEEGECPWKTDPTRMHRCDFHRFRYIASGDKRHEADTTGAFGIGFTAVYQITDAPELISAGRHWILHEDRPEQARIEVCPGCTKCSDPTFSGTRFILPWVRNPDSPLRRGLRAEAVSPDAPQRLLAELEHALPIAMLFLKRLRAIEVKWNGCRLHDFQREDDRDNLILSDGTPDKDRIWHLIHGDFSEVAHTLRANHPDYIEEKRSTKVTVAIPAVDQPTGLLCAYLPTQQNTGLPFYINADFFPTNDRKRVILAEDYQTAWNRAALSAAAIAVGQSIDRLPTLLGAKRLWSFFSTLKQVAEMEHGEPTLAEFWGKVEPRLKTAKVIYMTTGTWTNAAEAALLLQKEETPSIPLLEAMTISVVDEELRPYQGLLRSEAVGVPLLDIDRLCNTVASHGLTQRTEKTSWPPFLTKKSDRDTLWREIILLLERQQRTPKVKAEDEQRLKEIALAPGRDGALWLCGQLFIADRSTVSLFQSICSRIPFAEDDPEFKPLSNLCRQFDVRAGIEELEKIDGDLLATAWQEGRFVLSNLFAWFENRRQDILENPVAKEDFARLPIFPSSGKLHRLSELALPGNFNDNLGLAELVDLSALGGRREFMRDLGMHELTFRNYALSLLPDTLNNKFVSPEKRRAAVTLLSERLGEIKDDEGIRRALAETPLIECTDGEFRKARYCYFEGDTVRSCLSGDIYVTSLPCDQKTALCDLYDWLGVAHEPRLDDLAATVKNISKQPYSPDIVQTIQQIVTHLGKRLKESEIPSELEELSHMAWLPGKGKVDSWYRPNDLYAGYQAYLFESQALFLDVQVNIQQDSSKFLNALGVKATPTVNLVVKHLLWCCKNALPAHQDIYRFLNEKVDDPALNLLKDKRCLFLGEVYLAPSQVFWGEHSFGRFRRRLSEELRPYNNLMAKIDVRDAPNHEDALKVLQEIVREFGENNSPLDDEAHAVLMTCWRMLEIALNGGNELLDKIIALRKVKCIPNFGGILNPPEWMFFENRAGLAAKFGDFLKGNVIPRPLGAGAVMAAAGVRPLGSAVEIQLLECTDPSDDTAMADRILQRSNQFGRVLESQHPGAEAVTALQRLEKLQCESASSLLIRYHLHAFNRELESKPESVPALYQRDTEHLFFTRKNGNASSWSAIARELAIALYPEEDPGRIAAGLKEVLAADSVAAAVATLDELGFAGLDTRVTEPPEPGAPINTIGAETQPMTPEEAVKALLGEGAPAPTPLPPGLETDSPQTGGGGGSGKPGSPGKKKARPVLRSYVPPPDKSETDSPGDGDGEHQDRSPVDEAGVRHVLDHEIGSGRLPKEMPHKNPGYDIESRDTAGKVVRYIEVKSFSGRWNHTYAVLSRPQFEKATHLGNSFWLYVVEQAESESFRIHRIQNPALTANHFMFDDGWRSMAESDDKPAL